eukprot:Skav219863  [mRNA]  locus=scaffold859:875462:878158:- [translate_table: standard]
MPVPRRVLLGLAAALVLSQHRAWSGPEVVAQASLAGAMVATVARCPWLPPGLAELGSTVDDATVTWRLRQLRFFAAEDDCWPLLSEMCARRPEASGTRVGGHLVGSAPPGAGWEPGWTWSLDLGDLPRRPGDLGDLGDLGVGRFDTSNEVTTFTGSLVLGHWHIFNSAEQKPWIVDWLEQLQAFWVAVLCRSLLFGNVAQVLMDSSVEKLWEEDGLIAIHKPWGMRVYLPRNDAGNLTLLARTWPEELTVHDWLKRMYPNQARFHMCNRLDFATSGLMLVALNQQAAKHASALFRNREVQKFYQALVLGHPPAPWDAGQRLCSALVDVPGRFARAVAAPEAPGQAAETTVTVLQRGLWPKER